VKEAHKQARKQADDTHKPAANSQWHLSFMSKHSTATKYKR